MFQDGELFIYVFPVMLGYNSMKGMEYFVT
jgi:hypothetical protein